MRLLEELGLEVYRQYHEGTKVMQLSNGKIKTYNSDIPSMNPVALVETHFMIQKVSALLNSQKMFDYLGLTHLKMVAEGSLNIFAPPPQDEIASGKHILPPMTPLPLKIFFEDLLSPSIDDRQKYLPF